MSQIEKFPGGKNGLKIISVIMAVLLWFYVINQGELAARQDSIQVELKYYNLPEGLTVTGPNTVAVKLWGSFQKAGEIVAYVDLSGLSPGQYDLAVNIKPVRGAMFTTVQPDKVRVKLEKIQENTVPVNYEIRQNPPPGYSLLDVVLAPDKCIIKGEQEAVKKVAVVVAPVQLGNVKDIASFKIHLLAKDIHGNLVTEGIRLVPENAQVYAVVQQRKNSRKIAVKAQLNGKIADGYRVNQVKLEPDTVSVLGQDTKIASLSDVVNVTIDVTDKSESFSQELALTFPEGLTVFPTRVTANVDIGKLPEKEVP